MPAVSYTGGLLTRSHQLLRLDQLFDLLKVKNKSKKNASLHVHVGQRPTVKTTTSSVQGVCDLSTSISIPVGQVHTLAVQSWGFTLVITGLFPLCPPWH